MEFLIAGYALIFGFATALAAYYMYRKGNRGKIIVQVFSKDRTMRRHGVRPGPLNEIVVGDMTFTYDETAVVYSTAGLLSEEKPTLLYFEEEPDPINVYLKRAKSEKVSARELSRMMNDATVRDFVAAQQSFNPQSVFTAVIGMGIANMLATGVAAWYISGGNEVISGAGAAAGAGG